MIAPPGHREAWATAAPVPARLHLEHGSPDPLGAHWDGRGVNFALFSRHGERVELCVFDAGGEHEVARLPMPARTGDIWHGRLPEAGPGLLYGYRVFGPYDPHRGHRFNGHKLLLDPYARELAGAFRWNDAVLGYVAGHPDADLSFDALDKPRAFHSICRLPPNSR